MFDRKTSHVLLVGENPADLEAIRRELLAVEPGMVLDIARNEHEALSYLKIWDDGAPTPILILVELSAPDSGGLNVLRALKSHPRYRVLPVVMLCSPSDRELFDISDLKANSYVLIPADLEQFSEVMKKIHRYWCVLNVRPEG